LRQRMAAWVLALVAGAVPPGAARADPAAPSRTVQSDPHFAAWRLAQSEVAARARAMAEAGGACGADDALRPLLRRAHAARRDLRATLASQGLAAAPAPTAGPWPWGPGAGTTTRLAAVDSMDTAVLVDDGRLVFLNINTALEVDPFEAAQAFYHDYDDEYDFLLLFTNFYAELAGGQLLAYHLAVANAVEGLGYKHIYGTDHFNDGPDYTGRTALGSLQSVLNLADVRGYPDSMTSIYWRDYTPPTFMSHEIGHRWLARVRLCPGGGPENALLGRGGVHWSFFFDSRASVVEGNAWEGTPPDFVSGPPTIAYSPLDLYLMGMMAETEVPAGSLWYMAPPYDCSPSVDARGNPWAPESGPVSGVLCSGGRIDFDLPCLHEANGVRSPAYEEAQKSFRVATMLLTLPDTPVTQADLDKLVRMRAALGDFFSTQTLGRGSLDFRTHPVPAWVGYAHLPQGDVEDPTQPIPIHTRVTLEQRSLPTTLGDVRVFLHYSVNGGPFQELEMTRTDEEFTAAIPPQPLDSQVRYYLRGTTVLSSHETFFPADAPAASFLFRIAPDTTPPTIAHVPVLRHSRNTDPALLRAVVTDAHAVAQVQVEYGALGGPTALQDLVRQGTTDVWETRLQVPGELQVGNHLDYRIVARDGAVTPHVTHAPASGFTQMQITLVQTDDAEGDDPLWTHRSLRIEGTDEWHHDERQNTTANGRFCWKVGPTNVSTNPRLGEMALEQDAVLEGPAVLLKEGWELRFNHRNYLRTAPPQTDGSAMDGAVVQIQFADNPVEVAQDTWWLVESDDGYTHQFGYLALGNPLQWWPCWSGNFDAWRQEHVSENNYANFTGQRIRFRFRVSCSGPWQGTRGGAGWYVDDIEIDPGMPVPVTLEELQALRTEEGVHLRWKARELAAGDRFRLSRALMGGASTPQTGRFEPLATVDADPTQEEYLYIDKEASPGQAYTYRLTLMRGSDATSREISIGAAALRFALHPNRPNPFNPATEIVFDLPGRAPASLVVYDVRGERVRTLVTGTLEAGPHRLTWDGTDDRRRAVASGLYVAALESEGRRATRRLLLLR